MGMHVPTQHVCEQHIGSLKEEQEPKITVHSLSLVGAFVGAGFAITISFVGADATVSGACDGVAEGVSDGVSAVHGFCDAGEDETLGVLLGRLLAGSSTIGLRAATAKLRVLSKLLGVSVSELLIAFGTESAIMAAFTCAGVIV
jgi:hypothetical protein